MNSRIHTGRRLSCADPGKALDYPGAVNIMTRDDKPLGRWPEKSIAFHSLVREDYPEQEEQSKE